MLLEIEGDLLVAHTAQQRANEEPADEAGERGPQDDPEGEYGRVLEAETVDPPRRGEEDQEACRQDDRTPLE
jgi:hypothetical protein